LETIPFDTIHGVDLLIIVLIFLFLVRGLMTGLIKSVFNVIGLVAGILVAFRFYALAADVLLTFLAMPGWLADIITWVALFFTVQIAVVVIGSFLSLVNRFRLVRLVDRFGGGVAGIILGAAVAGIILLILVSFPLLPELESKIEEADLAPFLVDSTDYCYRQLTAFLPGSLPHMSFHPEEKLPASQSQETDVYDSPAEGLGQLKASTCVACEEKVDYLGFKTNSQGTLSTKFVCTGCGRTSDGCQTFEGHHLMYDKCPEELGRQGYRMDCGIWTNHDYIRPTGTCPVCEVD